MFRCGGAAARPADRRRGRPSARSDRAARGRSGRATIGSTWPERRAGKRCSGGRCDWRMRNLPSGRKRSAGLSLPSCAPRRRVVSRPSCGGCGGFRPCLRGARGSAPVRTSAVRGSSVIVRISAMPGLRPLSAARPCAGFRSPSASPFAETPFRALLQPAGGMPTPPSVRRCTERA